MEQASKEELNKLPEMPPELKKDAEDQPLIEKVEDILEHTEIDPENKEIGIKIDI